MTNQPGQPNTYNGQTSHIPLPRGGWVSVTHHPACERSSYTDTSRYGERAVLVCNGCGAHS